MDGIKDDGRELSPEEIEQILKTIPNKKISAKSRLPKEKPEANLARKVEVDIFERTSLAKPTAPHLLPSNGKNMNLRIEDILLQAQNKVSTPLFIESLSQFAMPPVSGVYFLINEIEEVVYVGQSINLLARISDHYKDKKKFPHFSKVAVLPVPPDKLFETEGKFIQALKPRLNGGENQSSMPCK